MTKPIKSPLTTELLNAIEYTPKSQDSAAEDRDEFVDNLRTVNTTHKSQQQGKMMIGRMG